VYDNYASKGNMEEEDQLGDSCVDIVVDVNQETFQQVLAHEFAVAFLVISQ
jgi:hypothetical protein